VALLIAGCARPAAERPVTAAPQRPVPWPANFVGAWCGPRTRERVPTTWCDATRGNISLVIRPLEDPGDRALNVALLGFLDSLAATGACAIDSVGVFHDPPRVVVRDRAVDPDEVTRAGWRGRVADMVRAYRGHASLAGYFLADEPAPREFDHVAELARAFAAADSVHPALVNLRGLDGRSAQATRARWADDAARLVTAGRLSVFSVDGDPFRDGIDYGDFVVSLAGAAEVSRRTGVPFAAVLQFTGFDAVPPVTAPEARELVGLSVAYGACGITWFTYRTPDPAEPGRAWRGGARAYDGATTDRTHLQAALGMEFRQLAAELGRGPRAVANFGSTPGDVALPGGAVPGVDAVSGGPCTLARAPGEGGTGAWLLVNRDRRGARTFDVRWYGPVDGAWVTTFDGVARSRVFVPGARRTAVTLAPGQAAALAPHAP